MRAFAARSGRHQHPVHALPYWALCILGRADRLLTVDPGAAQGLEFWHRLSGRHRSSRRVMPGTTADLAAMRSRSAASASARWRCRKFGERQRRPGPGAAPGGRRRRAARRGRAGQGGARAQFGGDVSLSAGGVRSGPKVSSELLWAGAQAVVYLHSGDPGLRLVPLRMAVRHRRDRLPDPRHRSRPLGFIALFDLEFNLTSVAAILTIVGFSLNDTVVMFDRMRENLRKLQDDAAAPSFSTSRSTRRWRAP